MVYYPIFFIIYLFNGLMPIYTKTMTPIDPENINGILTASSISYGFWSIVLTRRHRERTYQEKIALKGELKYYQEWQMMQKIITLLSLIMAFIYLFISISWLALSSVDHSIVSSFFALVWTLTGFVANIVILAYVSLLFSMKPPE